MTRILVLLVALVVSSHADAKRPGYIDARAINLVIQRADQLITVDKGADRGITKDWIPQLLVNDKVFETAKVTIVRVDRKTTIVKTNVTFDQMPKKLGVRFLPPGSAP